MHHPCDITFYTNAYYYKFHRYFYFIFFITLWLYFRIRFLNIRNYVYLQFFLYSAGYFYRLKNILFPVCYPLPYVYLPSASLNTLSTFNVAVSNDFLPSFSLWRISKPFLAAQWYLWLKEASDPLTRGMWPVYPAIGGKLGDIWLST